MARTHAAGSVRVHQDDGVVLGKGGVPIPTTPTRGVPTMYPHAQPTHVDVPEPVEPAPAPGPVEYEWRCDRTTWGRSMDGFQALHLLNAMMQKLFDKELAVVLTDEEARKLPADTRWHFRRQVRKGPPVEPAPEPETSVASERKSLPGAVRGAPLTAEFDLFILAALALGGDWTAARLRDFAVATDSSLGLVPNSDLRSVIVRLMNLTRTGQIVSLKNGIFRAKEDGVEAEEEPDVQEAPEPDIPQFKEPEREA